MAHESKSEFARPFAVGGGGGQGHSVDVSVAAVAFFFSPAFLGLSRARKLRVPVA